MYERFTDRARKVMQLANQEAQRFNHEYIGTEHVLLGLIKEGSGVAANVLKNLDIDLRKIRLEVEKIVQSGPDMVTMGKLPQTAVEALINGGLRRPAFKQVGNEPDQVESQQCRQNNPRDTPPYRAGKRAIQGRNTDARKQRHNRQQQKILLEIGTLRR